MNKPIEFNDKNARRIFPKEYAKIREEDLMVKMPNQKKTENKGNVNNKLNTLYGNLFDNPQGKREYLAIRKGTKVKFISLDE